MLTLNTRISTGYGRWYQPQLSIYSHTSNGRILPLYSPSCPLWGLALRRVARGANSDPSWSQSSLKCDSRGTTHLLPHFSHSLREQPQLDTSPAATSEICTGKKTTKNKTQASEHFAPKEREQMMCQFLDEADSTTEIGQEGKRDVEDCSQQSTIQQSEKKGVEDIFYQR